VLEPGGPHSAAASLAEMAWTAARPVNRGKTVAHEATSSPTELLTLRTMSDEAWGAAKPRADSAVVEGSSQHQHAMGKWFGRYHSFSEPTTVRAVHRAPIRLYISNRDPCARLLHVHCQDQVGVLFALSELLSRHGIDVDFADIAVVGDHVDNRFVLRAPRPSDFADACEWCLELEQVALRGRPADSPFGDSGSLGSAADQSLIGNAVGLEGDTTADTPAAQVAAGAARLGVNPHLLCVSAFRQVGPPSQEEALFGERKLVHRYSLELKGINQAGLLAYIAWVCSISGFSIRRARISTREGQVSDVFEVASSSPDAVRLLQRYINLPMHMDESSSLPNLQQLWAGETPMQSASVQVFDEDAGGVAVGGSNREHLQLPNGDSYSGYLSSGGQHRHGYGIYNYVDTRAKYLRYTGQFHMNAKHGFGTLLMRDGSAYVGQWSENQRHGVGVMLGYGSEGAKGQACMPTYRYEGEWQNDRADGIGVEETEEHLYFGRFERGAHRWRGLKIPLGKSGLATVTQALDAGVWRPLSQVLAQEDEDVSTATLTAYNAQTFLFGAGKGVIAPKTALTSPYDMKAASGGVVSKEGSVEKTASGSAVLVAGVDKPASSNGALAAAAAAMQEGNVEKTANGSAVLVAGVDKPASSNGPLAAAADAMVAQAKPEQIPGSLVSSPGTAAEAPAALTRTPTESRPGSPELPLRRRLPVVASPMLWREPELAKVVGCLGVAPVAAERLASSRLGGALQIVELSNARMSQELGLVAPLERLVVRRALQHLLEADRYANSSRGRCLRDVMDNPGLRACMIPLERLTLSSTISQGGFGIVFRGVLAPPPPTPPPNGAAAPTAPSPAGRSAMARGNELEQVVAVKEMLGDHRVRLYELLKEAQVMASLKHPNICRFIGVCTDGQPKGKRYIVSELLHCSLFDLLHRPLMVPYTERFEMLSAIQLCEGICCGLAYVHGRSLVHADLKSSNILIDLTDPSKPLPRICDFGHAAVRISSSPHDRLCTPHWAAPEVLRGEGLGSAADVFSVGVLFWEMLAKKVPHEELTFGQVLASVGWAGSTPDMDLLPPNLPTEMRTLLENLLRFLPSERPSAAVARRRLQRLPRLAKQRAVDALMAFLGCGC